MVMTEGAADGTTKFFFFSNKISSLLYQDMLAAGLDISGR